MRQACGFFLTIAFAVLAFAAPAAADWQPAVDLAPPGSPDGAPCETGSPSVAAAPDGSFLVAWLRRLDADTEGTTVVEARRIAADGTPGPLLRLTDTPGNYDAVTAAIGPDGAGIVIWHHLPVGVCGNVAGPIPLESRRVGADSALGPMVPVSDGTDKALLADVVVHPSGVATVGWTHQISSFTSQVKVRQLPVSGPPGPVSILSPALEQSQEVKLAVDPQDRTLVVWNEHGQLQTQRLAPDGTPQPPVTNLTPVDDTSSEPDVGIDASGRARLVWVRFGPQPITVLTRTIAIDGSLSDPVELASGADKPVVPRLAINASGATAFAWFTSPEQGSDFAYGRILHANGALAPPVTLSGPGAGVDMLPTVNLDADGNALSVWQRNLGGKGVVEAVQFSDDDIDSEVKRLSNDSLNLLQPDMDGNPGGGAFAAWAEDAPDGENVIVKGARFVPPPRPANDVSASSPTGGPSTTSGAGATTTPPGALGPELQRSASLDVLTRRARVSRSGIFRVRLRCVATGIDDCAGPVTVQAALAGKASAAARRRVATKRVRAVGAGDAVTVRLRLASSARRALKRTGRLRAVATTKTRQPGEAASVDTGSIALVGHRG
jgi:hypothetical protein